MRFRDRANDGKSSTLSLNQEVLGTVNEDTPPGTLRELQHDLTDLRKRGLGKAKSAAIDALRENIAEALRLGFHRQEIWESLREVGYEGSYRYFGTKLHRLGITRSRVTSPAPFLPTTIALGRSGITVTSRAVAEKEEPGSSTEPMPLNAVEVQRRRLDEARRRGDIYRKPKPQPKKTFVFNPED
jgi:hypothetical protein